MQLLLIVVFLLLIVYFLHTYSADISSLRLLSFLDILLIGIWSFVSYAAYSYAVYSMLLHSGLQGISPYGWLRIYFVSRLANLFVLQGGNLFRLVLLKKKHDIPYAKSLGITVFLIWINMLIALLAALGFLLSTATSAVVLGVELSSWILFVALAVLAGALLVVSVVQRYRAARIWQTRMFEPVLTISDLFVRVLKNARLMSKISSLSVVHFAFFTGVNYFAFHAIGEAIGVTSACLFTTAFVFTRYVNVVPGNLGLSELVGGLVSEYLGIGFGNGLVVSSVVRIVEVLMIVLLGLLYGKMAAINFLRDRID